MAYVPANRTTWTQDSSKAQYVAVPEGVSVKVANSGNTLYYKSTSDVTSSSNDGSIASGASATFTTGAYVITASGASTQVTASNGEGISNARGVPRNIATWQPVAATSGTDTACTNGTAYVGSVYVPMDCQATGIEYLIGSVGGTDKVVASLHDINGNPLANSATAGATVGTAANSQQVAFSAAYNIDGPNYYFLALTFNGTTAKFRSVPAFTQSGAVGNGVTQTFGTVAAFTAPTTFTADKIPVCWLY